MTDTNAGPVLPELTYILGLLTTGQHERINEWGLQCWNACDEQVAGPLRERVAELERESARSKAKREAADACIGAWIDKDRETQTNLSAARAELARLRAENEALSDCLRECAGDLAAEINARVGGELPRRIERDLEPVRRARELLAARAAREGK
jgi:hypothetical protein